MSSQDHYAVIGVAHTATPAAIKAAYRAAVKCHHPDANGSAAAFNRLQEAYEVLADAERRAAYDRALLPAHEEECAPVEPDDYIPESWPPPQPDYVPDRWPAPEPAPVDRSGHDGVDGDGVNAWPAAAGATGRRAPDWPLVNWRVCRLALAMPVPPGIRGKAAALFALFLVAAAIERAALRAPGAVRVLGELTAVALFYVPVVLLLVRAALAACVRLEVPARRCADCLRSLRGVRE